MLYKMLLRESGYRPGGLKNGTEPNKPSTSTGTLRVRLRSSGVAVLAFQVLNHGPPPTSNAAMSLVTSNIIYSFKQENCKISRKEVAFQRPNPMKAEHTFPLVPSYLRSHSCNVSSPKQVSLQAGARPASEVGARNVVPGYFVVAFSST